MISHKRRAVNPELDTAALRLYMDESGSSDPGTPHAVIGGIFISRKRFHQFEAEWSSMLDFYKIAPPLHMKEFGRPDGSLASVPDSRRRSLLTEAVSLIRRHRTGSISVSLSNSDYRRFCPQEAVKRFSVYGMCFVLAAFGTHVLAEKNSYQERIPMILDNGNPYTNHVRESHATMQEIQRAGEFLHVGPLLFEDDENINALQAADLIAWGARRRATGVPFGRAFQPIGGVFSDSARHTEAEWRTDWVRELGAHLARQLSDRSSQ